MAKPFEQDVILDADGKPLFAAMDLLERRIGNIQKTIKQIQNDSYKTAADFNKTLEANIKGLQQAQSQMRTLSQMGSTEFRANRAAAPASVAALVGSQGLDKTALGLRFEREVAFQRLQAAGTEKERQAALRALDLANARVAAVQRLVAEETKATAAVERQNRAQSTDQARARLALSRAYSAEQIKQLGAEDAIARQKERVANAERALTGATAATNKQLLEALNLENARLRAHERLSAQMAREQRMQAAGGGPGGPGGPPSRLANILTPGYAAAAFARTSVYGAAAGAAYGAFSTVSDSLSGVVQLQDELAKLQAISNSTDSQMQVLRGTIFDIGSTSRYSIVDIAKMAQVLAQAGITANDMGAVLSSVTRLATASGSTPDEAVQLLTSALGSFQLQSSEAARVADLMTAALNRTKLTVQQTGQAIQYVGATAFEQNISLEQLLATIGAVAQAGVRSGSTIGTGFRQFLVDLQDPSKKLTEQLEALKLTKSDVDVSVRGLPAVLETLRDAGFGASQAYEGLEVRAAAFYLTAKNNIEVMDQLQLAFAQQGASAIANERAMNSLTAQWQRFKNILMEGFSDSMTNVMTILQNIVMQLADRITQMQDSANKLRQLQDSGQAKWYQKDLSPIIGQVVGDTMDLLSNPLQLGGGGGIGTWLRDLEKSANGATDASARLATQIAESSEKIDAQKGKTAELEKEMLRLIVQKDSLRNNDIRSAAETATLTARFEGLAQYLVITGNRYDDLAAAAKRYRLEQLKLFGGQLDQQNTLLYRSNVDARTRLRGQISNAQASPEIMNALTPQQRAALNAVSGNASSSPQFQQGLGILNDAVRTLGTTNKGVADQLFKITSTAGNLATTAAQWSSLQPQLRANEAMRSPAGQEVFNVVQQVEAAIEKMGSLDNGNAEKTRLGNTSLASLSTLEKRLEGLLKKPLEAGARAWVQGALQDIPGLRNQINAQMRATSDEQKAAAKAQRDANREQREAERGRLLTQSELDRVAQEVTGLGLGSGIRSREEQARLKRIGATNAGPDESAHSNGGLARDLPTGNMSREDAMRLAAALGAKYKAMGLDVFVQWESGKGAGQGTGPHIHVSARKGTRFKGSDGGSGGDPDANDALSQMIKTEKLDLANAERELKLRMTDLARSTSDETFNASMARTKEALDAVNLKLESVTLSELAQAGITSGPEFEARMAELREKQEQNVEGYQNGLLNALQKMTSAILKNAQESFEAATAGADARLRVSQATSSGLSLYSNRNRVPDYTKQLADAASARAAEQLEQSKLLAIPAKIAETQRALDALIRQQDAGTLSGAAAQVLAEDIKRVNNELTALHATRDSLAASLGAGGMVPQTFGEGLQQAIQAYRELNNLNETFEQTMIMNVGGAISTVQDGLTNMFTSIVDGSRTAAQAFGDFAQAIMKYILQIVAKIIATKIIGLLFNIIGGAAMPGFDSSAALPVGSGSTPLPMAGGFTGSPLNQGGPVGYNTGGHVIPGFARGGHVTNGSLANMDSVLAKLTRGEFVMRRKAVESVGTKFMARLNEQGAAALNSTQQMPAIEVKPVTDIKVYMVKPNERPQLGPNDVLVTWQDDVLRGGESRKLIQHVVRDTMR